MKKFLFLAALVLGLASCQTEPESFDVNVGGEQTVTISVSIPETETRAGGPNSALGVFDNASDVKIRYIFEVYYNGETQSDLRQEKVGTEKSMAFDVRLVPGRDYQFVVWADVAEANGEVVNHYNTDNLKNITLNNTWVAMDETRDAFTATVSVNDYSGVSSINIPLTRPFAKLRVVTTDMAALNDLGIAPAYAMVRYSTKHYESFNAFDGSYAGEKSVVEHTYEIASTYGESGDDDRTLFTDYFFANNEVVKFDMSVYEDEAMNNLIKYNNFNTDINVKRNYLTTITGNILTDGKGFMVTINDAFENAGGTDPDYEYGVITSAVDLFRAIARGGNFMLGNDIIITKGDIAIYEATRAAGITATIDLNGYTITFEDDVTVEVPAGNELIIIDSSEDTTGSIKVGNNAGIVNEGSVIIEGGNIDDNTVTNQNGGEATITNSDVNPNAVAGDNVTNYAADLISAFENGGEFKLGADVTIGTGYMLAADKELVLDLGGNTITSYSQDFNGSISSMLDVRGTLSVKNGTITTAHQGQDYGWSKGAEIFYVGFNGTLNVEDATLENLGGTAMAYCIDLVNSTGITVNVRNSTLKATYIPFRVFNNGQGMNNVTIENTTLDGKYCFWVHIYTNKDNGGKGVKSATLNINDIFNSGNTFKFNNVKSAAVIYGFDDEIYYDAEGNTMIFDIEGLKAAIKAGGNYALANNITIADKWDERYGGRTSQPFSINGNNNTIKFTGEVSDGYNFHAAFRFENTATVKNLTIDMSEATAPGKWLRAISSHGELTVEKCTFIGNTNYSKANAIVFGDKSGVAQHDYSATISDCSFTNWSRGISDNENANEVKSVVVSGNTCTNAHIYVSAYESITATNNVMGNSAINITSYSNAANAKVVATGNTLDAEQYNIIGSANKLFTKTNVEAQEGFIVNAQ